MPVFCFVAILTENLKNMVCFDIGGVLAKISTTWGDAAANAGIDLGNEDACKQSMHHCPNFDEYQNGLVTTEQYLSSLSQFLEVGKDEAERVHAGILVSPYEGTIELVTDLCNSGRKTACLSNTNERHWPTLISKKHYPAIAMLDFKVASHEIKLMKPDSEAYEEFQRITNTTAAEIVFFDDGAGNVGGANACGWQAHRIDPSGDPVLQMREILGLS